MQRTRAALAAVAGVLAVVVIVAASAGWWAQRTLTSSDWVGPRVESLLADPVVSEALAGRLVDAVGESLDIRSAAVDLLPPAMEPAVDLVLAGARSTARAVVAEAIRSERVRGAVAEGATRAYDGAVALVRGDSVVDGVTVVGDEVRLNALPLVSRALVAFQGVGLFRGVDVPEFDRSGDPVEQRRALADALGRELPDDFGEIVVYRSSTVEQASDGLASAQRLFVLLGRATWVLTLAGVALAATSMALSARRWRTLGLLGLGLGVALVAVQFVTARLVSAARDLATAPAGDIVIADLVGELQQRLVRTTGVVIVITVLVLGAAAFVASRRPSADGPA